VFKSTDGHRTAVVVYGPYREEKMYADLASDFMLKLLGLTHGYDKIVAVMPTGVHQDHFDAHLKRLVESKIEFRHFDKDTLEMLPPEMPTMTP
jgi:hypothetical protein